MGETLELQNVTVEQAVAGSFEATRNHLRAWESLVLLAGILAEEHSRETGDPIPDAIASAAASPRGKVPDQVVENILTATGGHLSSAEGRRAMWLSILDTTTINDNVISEHSSSTSIAHLSATVLTADVDQLPDDPTIWDPCVGTGRVLVEVANALRALGKRPRLVAWDCNPDVLALATTTCWLWDYPFDIRLADSLLAQSEARTVAADLAVSNPPFNLMWKRREDEVRSAHEDGGFAWGVPPVQEGSWLFSQTLWQGLGPNGKALQFTSRSPLSATSTNDIRVSVMQEDAVHSVIMLPEGMSPVSQINMYAVLFDKNKPQSRDSKVSFIDLRDFFEQAHRSSRSPRTLTAGADEAVGKGLRSIKPTRVSRTVDMNELELLKLRVTYPKLDEKSTKVSGVFEISGTMSPQVWSRDRYGTKSAVQISPESRTRIDLTGDFVFGAQGPKLDTSKSERLSCAITSIRTRVKKSQSAAARNSFGIEREEPWIVVRAGRVHLEDEAPDINTIGDSIGNGGSWHFAFQVDPTYDPAFVVSFLEWQYGQLPLRRPGDFGLPSLNVSSILSRLDDVVIPRVSGDQQSKIVSTLELLGAVESQRRADLDALWMQEDSSAEVRDRVRGYLGGTSVEDRLRKWPNPIASAAWNVKINKGEPKALEHALVQFWEAVAAFHASILLSALKSIPDLEQHSLESIRSGIAKTSHLSLSEASMGAYSLITTTTANIIRSYLSKENGGTSADDEKAALAAATKAQIQSAFGNMSLRHINTLVSKDLASIFERLRPLRTVGVHGGMETKAQLQERTEKMYDLINEWDALTRALWSETLLVRGGPSDRFEKHWEQEVEVAVGNDYPFAKSKVNVGDAMKSGSLCLYSSSEESFMELSASLFHFMEVPDDNKFACYFFNRMSANELDLKSLVYPSPMHGGLDVSPEISGTVKWLIGEQPVGAS